MKIYKVTTLRGFGAPFVRTVEVDSEAEAMEIVRKIENPNEVIAFCEEVI